MSVIVTSDIAGHTMTLDVNGSRLTMDMGTAYKVAHYIGVTLDQLAKQQLGSSLSAPFMTLSFMALLVIPALKLSDKGLFNGQMFRFTPLQIMK